jgi:hypothetical protein
VSPGHFSFAITLASAGCGGRDGVGSADELDTRRKKVAALIESLRQSFGEPPYWDI